VTQSDAPHIPTADELGAALLPKHLALADTYLTNGLNGAAAARHLKYKNPTEGPRILRRLDVKAYVKARLEENQVGKAYIKARLEYFASGDMADFTRVAPTERSYWVRADAHDEVREFAKRRGKLPSQLDNYDLASLVGGENVAQTEEGVLMVCIRKVDAEVTVDWRAVEKGHAMGRVKKLKVGKDGSVEFELYDAMRANELLGKAEKMFVEKHELSTPDGEPLKLYANVRLDDV
jgi:hypothetical protein